MSLEGRLSVQQCSNQSLLFNDVQNEPWFWSVDREKSKDLISKGKLTDRVCTVSIAQFLRVQRSNFKR